MEESEQLPPFKQMKILRMRIIKTSPSDIRVLSSLFCQGHHKASIAIHNKNGPSGAGDKVAAGLLAEVIFAEAGPEGGMPERMCATKPLLRPEPLVCRISSPFFALSSMIAQLGKQESIVRKQKVGEQRKKM